MDLIKIFKNIFRRLNDRIERSIISHFFISSLRKSIPLSWHFTNLTRYWMYYIIFISTKSSISNITIMKNAFFIHIIVMRYTF